MVYSPIVNAFRQSPEEAGGQPNYMSALKNVFSGLQSAAETAYKPSQMAEDLLKTQLANKINKPKAEDAQGWYDLQKQGLSGQNSLRSLQLESLRRKAQMEKDNPFINAPGDLGKIGALLYIQKHPELFGEQNQQPSNEEIPFSEKEKQRMSSIKQDDSFIPSIGSGVNKESLPQDSSSKPNYARLIHQSIIKSLLPKEDVLQGPARNVEDLKKLKEKYGESSTEYQQAKAIMNADIGSKEALAKQRTGEVPRLKPGESYIKDDAGQLIGVNHPLTQKEADEISGRTFFNETYPIVNKGASFFTGEDSITRLENAAANYKTNPKARQVFDDFLLAEKLSATTAVKEAATVGAGKQKEVFNQFKDALAKSDVPKLLQRLIKEYQIPASAQYKAGLRMQEVLNSASEKSAASIPATVPRYFNPQKQKQKTEKGKPIKMVWENGVLVRAK